MFEYALPAFEKNQVTFVTFNFDTIIEDRFRRSVESTYLQDANDFPPVVHVHGKLLPVPVAKIGDGNSGFDSSWIDWTLKVAANINVVFDEIDQSTLQAARRAVSEAAIVCFLGFGYDPENLKRLGFPAVLENTCEWFGTAFGYEEGERSQLKQRFGRMKDNLQLGGKEENCVDVLRRFRIFRD